MASPRKPKPLVLRVEIEPEHVEALNGLLAPARVTGTPKLRSVEHEDPALVRREAMLAEREARVEEAERRVAELQAELDSSSEGTASSKIRLANREKRLPARRLVLDDDCDVRHVVAKLRRQRVERLLHAVVEVDVHAAEVSLVRYAHRGGCAGRARRRW